MLLNKPWHGFCGQGRGDKDCNPQINFLPRGTGPTAGALSPPDQPKAALSLSNTVILAKLCQLAQPLTFTKGQLSPCSFGGGFFCHGVIRAETGSLLKYYRSLFSPPGGML